MSATTLTVTGMTCGHCKAKVAKALSQVAGVYAVDVDLVHGTAEVDAAPATVADQLIAAVRAVGYEAKVAS